jgi:hypothetical protein
VLTELGLDRYPELWPDYFGHYRRLVWLAQQPDPSLQAEAKAVAAMFGLPLTVLETGTARLERELENLIRTTSDIDHGFSPHSMRPVRAAGRFVTNCAHGTHAKNSV